MKFRIGFGYDVHRLEEGAEFMLGGIRLEHEKGAVGHSDADVLIHAICDALLGAANLRDIGYHFPPSSDQYKGADSKALLKEVLELLKKKGYSIGNIDATVSLQRPRISQLVPQMVKVLSKVMQLDENDLSVKATTTETLGFVGSEDGVAAHAVALIHKENNTRE